MTTSLQATLTCRVHEDPGLRGLGGEAEQEELAWALAAPQCQLRLLQPAPAQEPSPCHVQSEVSKPGPQLTYHL